MAFYVKQASPSNTRHTGGARHRRKDDRMEREIVRRHIALGFRSKDTAGHFLRRNKADPLVCLPWRVWARQLKGVRE